MPIRASTDRSQVMVEAVGSRQFWPIIRLCGAGQRSRFIAGVNPRTEEQGGIG